MSTATEQSKNTTNKSFRDLGWLRAGLGLGSAYMTQELAEQWGQHLTSPDIYPLSVAVGMFCYNLHLLNLKPPTDPRSKLRALWLPEQKKQALLVAVLTLLASSVYLFSRLSHEIKVLTLDDIQALRPIDRGFHLLSGTPQIEANPYRWVFDDYNNTEQAPYLTPIKEFNGQVLVVSSQVFKEPLAQQKGWVSELSMLARPHYVAYRNYMGLSSNAPIYLFDIRGIWWFDPYGFAAVLASLLLLCGTIGSATRDPENSSKLLFIPKDLRGNLNEDAESSFDEEANEVAEKNEVVDKDTESSLDEEANEVAEKNEVVDKDIESSLDEGANETVEENEVVDQNT